jgi:hypothetical protein
MFECHFFQAKYYDYGMTQQTTNQGFVVYQALNDSIRVRLLDGYMGAQS